MAFPSFYWYFPTIKRFYSCKTVKKLCHYSFLHHGYKNDALCILLLVTKNFKRRSVIDMLHKNKYFLSIMTDLIFDLNQANPLNLFGDK